MSGLLGWTGATVGGALGWWAGERGGLFPAFLVSVLGTGVGWYLGRRVAARLVE